MTNRMILVHMGLAVALIGLGLHSRQVVAQPPIQSLDADLLIVGGTESGCAAAIQAARMGVKNIVLVNDIDWLGGQFSAEALGAIDENRAVSGTNETPFSRNGLFQDVMKRIETFNQTTYGHPRPGNTVVKTTVRASDAAKIFHDMLQPWIEKGQVRVVSHHYPVAADLSPDRKRLLGLQFAVVPKTWNSTPPVVTLVVKAKLTIDASDWGEAIRAAGAEFEFGPDLKSKYGEPTAPTNRDLYPITDMNPLTWCFVIEETDQEAIIAKPERYDERRYLQMTSLTYPEYLKVGWTHKRVYGPTFPVPEIIYKSRRLLDPVNLKLKVDRTVLLINTPPQNYPLDRLPQVVIDELEAIEAGASKKNIAQMSRREREAIFKDARLHTLGFLYHLQTTVHEKMSLEQRKKANFRRFRLTDEFGTPDQLPPKPYVRESLRLKALTMMKEQDTLRTDRKADQFAVLMHPDGVGSWQFEYDFHPTARGFLPGQGSAGPWESYGKPGRGWGPYSDRAVLPLRSLIPERVDGLLAAQHNIGFSSIVSSAVRLHDHSMMIGQAAGAAAAVSLQHDQQPRAIPYSPALLTAIRRGLCSRLDDATPATLWPFRDLNPDHPAFEAINLLACGGHLPLARADIDFRPDTAATHEWRAAVVRQTGLRKTLPAGNELPPPPAGALSRGEFLQRWWEHVKDLPDSPLLREGTKERSVLER